MERPGRTRAIGSVRPRVRAVAAAAFPSWRSSRLPGCGLRRRPGRHWLRLRLRQPFIPDITERSGLLMRFASSPEMLPPDPHRDFFYNTRYADNGRVKHPNWVCTQGLYGLGWKTPDTKSVYPYFYGVPGQNTVDSSSRPWFRPSASSRASPIRSAPSGRTTRSEPTCRSTTSTRSRRDRAPIRIRSTSTGCTAAEREQIAQCRCTRDGPSRPRGGPSPCGRARARLGHSAPQRISGDRFSAASVMNAWIRATRSSGSGVTPSRIIASLQSCSPHCLMKSWC